MDNSVQEFIYYKRYKEVWRIKR